MKEHKFSLRRRNRTKPCENIQSRLKVLRNGLRRPDYVDKIRRRAYGYAAWAVNPTCLLNAQSDEPAPAPKAYVGIQKLRVASFQICSPKLSN